MSTAEFKRDALDVAEWLFGAISGGFNHKQTIGQVVFDATLSAFPIAGELTAGRDLTAQLIRMSKDPALRKEALEWVTLLLPLLAIVPIVGGLLKGIGKLLMGVGKSAAEDREILRAIIKLCNKIGRGDAIRYVKELDFNKYRQPLIDGFGSVCQRLNDALRYLSDKMKNVLPREAIDEFNALREQLDKLQRLGAHMIPQAVRDLNARLKRIQTLLYSGEWHTVQSGTRNVTREAEARLVEEGSPHVKPKGKGWPQNKYEDYKHVEGWPDLRKRAYRDKEGKWHAESIEAFSGPLIARTVKGPKTVYRVLKPTRNGKASPWWMENMPANGQEWREGLAVLDNFNINNFFIKYDIPAEAELRVWEGHAAEQVNIETGQYLLGGSNQLFIEWPKEMADAIGKLSAFSTTWGKTTKRYGYESATDAKNVARVEELGKAEYASKRPLVKEDQS